MDNNNGYLHPKACSDLWPRRRHAADPSVSPTHLACYPSVRGGHHCNSKN